MAKIAKFCPKMIMPEKFWSIYWPLCNGAWRGAAACTTPKCTGRSPFRAIFFPSPSKKCLIRLANLIWLVGSYSLTHSLIWPTTDLLIDMHFLILGPSIRSHSIFRFQVGHSNNSHHCNKWRVLLIVFFLDFALSSCKNSSLFLYWLLRFFHSYIVVLKVS